MRKRIGLKLRIESTINNFWLSEGLQLCEIFHGKKYRCISIVSRAVPIIWFGKMRISHLWFGNDSSGSLNANRTQIVNPIWTIDNFCLSEKFQPYEIFMAKSKFKYFKSKVLELSKLIVGHTICILHKYFEIYAIYSISD